MAQFTNQAQLSYNSTVLNSNIAVGEIIEVLSATKSTLSDEYSMGDDIVYIINIMNSGSSAFTGLSVSDNLGAYEYNESTLYPLLYVAGSAQIYVNGVLQTATPTVSAGPPLVFSGLNVPANSNMTIIYKAQASRFAPFDIEGSIVNTATISGAGLTNPITAAATIYPVSAPSLSIIKSINPSVVTENSTVNYTFTLQNFGNTAATATDNARITDTFNPLLSDIAVTFNGATWAEPTNYTYNETTGLFATVPGQITVPAATYTQDTETGVWTISPGTSTLVVRGTI